jgi:hypothetical protein
MDAAFFGIGTGAPPIDTPYFGIGTGAPPIEFAIFGIGTGAPPIPAKLCFSETPVRTTKTASTKDNA